MEMNKVLFKGDLLSGNKEYFANNKRLATLAETGGNQTSSATHNSSMPSNNSKSGNSTTTVVVEQHGPVQVWVACGACGHNPGVCQTCVGMGTSASGRTCISCHGTGKCHFCNGQGGRYQVEYR